MKFEAEKCSFLYGDDAEWVRETDFLRSLGLNVPSLKTKPSSRSGQEFDLRHPSPHFWDAEPDAVDKTDFAADLFILQFAVKRAYAGAGKAASNGWDWNDFFSRWRKRVLDSADPRMSIEFAFQPWEELARVQIDNHSGPKLSVAYNALSLSQTLIVPGADDKVLTHIRNASGDVRRLSSTDLAGQPWAAFCSCDAGPLTSCRALSYPSRNGETWVAGKADDAWVPLIPLPVDRDRREKSLRLLGASSEDELFSRELSLNTGYLRIPTLTHETAQAAANLTRRTPPTAFKKSNIIVDLRGNAGGAAVAVSEILDCVPGWQELDWQNSFSTDIVHSSTSNALQWGEVQRQLKDVRMPLTNRMLRHVQAVFDKVCESEVDVSDREKVSRFSSKRSFRDHRFPWHPTPGYPRIHVLTDSECGSDGEFIAYALSLIPGSVILGTATGGVAQFGRPGCLLLPRTRIPFRLASAFIDIHGDGRAFDGYGLKPDILLSQEKPLSPAKLLQLVDEVAKLVSELPIDTAGTVK